MRSSRPLFATFISTALFVLPIVTHTQEKAAAKPATPEKSAEAALPADSTTQGSVEVSGQRIDYTAVAGTITVGATDEEDAQLDPEGKPLPGSQLALTPPKEPADAPPLAHMFYVAYFKTGAKADDRPVTFFYNGGPGSSTMWLHLGSLGPKYVETAGDKHLPGAPYKLVDNPYCLLDTSDEVFIDMPGTGFGRITGKDAAKAFWGVDEDAGAFARFIARFLTKYNRWNSPKYLFGESYGTTRSAVLANLLENDKNIDLNGVMLLGQVFNFPIAAGVGAARPGMDLPYALVLPTYAATAWYHKKLSPQPPDLTAFLKQVEDFALGDYLHALGEGTAIADAEKQSVAEKVHDYTGLPVAYILKADLRVNPAEFQKTFADEQDMTTGRYDTRFLGPTIDPLSEGADYDPQSAAISSAYVSMINSYLRNTLKYGANETYLPSALFSGAHWDWARHGHGDFFTSVLGVNVSDDLADAMKTNPHLKIMVNDGYYDLATPFFAAQYDEEHLPIPPALTKNIEYNWYESGHMAYVRDESRQQLHDRVAAFIKSSEAGKM
ncbi:MAG TPA: peptidase S10 [Terracidiphilus sp.]|nr:peptidase S10 [Terracidiphilus sp.]